MSLSVVAQTEAWISGRGPFEPGAEKRPIKRRLWGLLGDQQPGCGEGEPIPSSELIRRPNRPRQSEFKKGSPGIVWAFPSGGTRSLVIARVVKPPEKSNMPSDPTLRSKPVLTLVLEQRMDHPLAAFSGKAFGLCRIGLLFTLAVGSLVQTGGAESLQGKRADSHGRSSTPSPSDTSVWLDPEGKPLPFQTHEEVLSFLRTAEVVSKEHVGEGINNPWKILLEKDGVRLHAVFRDVEIKKDRVKSGQRGWQLDFRDDFVYECAAYELSRLVGMDNVPPTVARKVGQLEGSLQLWIENAFTEKSRKAKNLKPVNRRRWALERQLMYLFDNLIFNDDRNQSNILYDSEWKLWMIDHTRAFRRFSRLKNPSVLRYCERSVLKKLKTLDGERVKQRLKELLTGREISSLLKRRDELVKHFQHQIDTRGEQVVLWDFQEFRDGS